MRVHFIAIGGSAMHNLAIALYNKGYQVTGSDDEIFEPAKSRLEERGLLPSSVGWFPEKITENLDAVILGMHAHKDNPELEKAMELGIPVHSYPEFLYLQTKNKRRVVIGGSHGKTTITSMILHVLKACGVEHDYMVGAQLEGFDCMVKLTEAPLVIFEGDEYLSSALDPSPKFLHYRPHIALISGIAWDHINVFPSFAKYTQQFKLFTERIGPEGKLFLYGKDPQLQVLRQHLRPDIISETYFEIPHEIKDGQTILHFDHRTFPILIFGAHNMQNMEGARMICRELGISDLKFFEAISTFQGADNRLQLLCDHPSGKVFKDFAHSPSKLKATVAALKTQFPDKRLVACMELHTYSSLSTQFLPHYRNSLNPADECMVYYSPKALTSKRLPPITPSQIRDAFNKDQLKVFTTTEQIENFLNHLELKDSVLLMMSSGNWGGADVFKTIEKKVKELGTD